METTLYAILRLRKLTKRENVQSKQDVLEKKACVNSGLFIRGARTGTKYLLEIGCGSGFYDY
jgi:hypothetical protein